MMRSLANMFSFFVAGFLMIASAAIMHLWPASFWFEVRDVRVFDSRAGQPAVMAVDRTIRRDFRGEWLVSIRRLEHGGWVSYCTARGESNYVRDSQLPDPLALSWWTYPSCNPLPPGRYVMRTSWVITDPSFLPDKEVQADSNIFEVTP